MQGFHRLGATDRTLLWGTAALIVFTLGAVTVARTNGGPIVGADDSHLCYNSAGVGSACLPPAPTAFDDATVPSASIPSLTVTTSAAPPSSGQPSPSVPPPPTVTRPPTTTSTRSPSARKVVPAWAVGVTYRENAQVTYQGRSYACLQPHTSQSDWSPVAAPALWSRVS